MKYRLGGARAGLHLLTLVLALTMNNCMDGVDYGEGSTSDEVERVSWEFGAVEGGGGAGGAGGAGAPDIVTLDDFEQAVDDFMTFVNDCGTFRAGTFSFGRFSSTPYQARLLSCIESTAVCASQRQYLCNDYPEEWVDCFKQLEKFTCEDGEVIPGNYECDTYVDCDGGDDERNCQALWFRCDDGSAVLHSAHCNKQVDCPDASDEQDCSISYFVCDNNKGIPSWMVCDGEHDCVDGSDEDEGCAKISCD